MNAEPRGGRAWSAPVWGRRGGGRAVASPTLLRPTSCSTPRHHGTPMLREQARVHDRSSHLKLETTCPFALREPHLEHSTRTLGNRESGRIEGHRDGSRMWLRIPLLRRPSLNVCPGRGSTIPRSRDWRGHASPPCVEAEPGLLAALLQCDRSPLAAKADDALRRKFKNPSTSSCPRKLGAPKRVTRATIPRRRSCASRTGSFEVGGRTSRSRKDSADGSLSPLEGREPPALRSLVGRRPTIG